MFTGQAFQIDHHLWQDGGKKIGMAGYDFSLEFECPICGAPPQERCVMMSGNFRSASHIERHRIGGDHQTKWPITNASSAIARKPLVSGRSRVGQNEAT
jgi:hypothetical protein